MTAASQPPQASPPRLLRSSAVVSAMTMISRVLGLVRDVVFAIFVGAAGGADAFFVAFKIPNFLRRLFAEGAFAQAFVPVLSELRARGDHSIIRHFVNHIAGCLGLSVIIVSAFAVMAAPVITLLFAPGFYLNDPEKYALTVDLIRITFPYLAFISLAGFAGSILNSYDRFAIPALTPVILNLVLITAAMGFASKVETPSMALAWGVLVAGILQFGFQLPFLAKIRLLPVPIPVWKDPLVKKVLTLMAPAIFGVSVSQINLLLDTVLASLISDGSVSWLYYSDRLIELPLGVFGVAIATVILPALSRQHAQGSQADYSHTLDWALRNVLLISVPATAALVVLAEPLIATLFQHGARFTALDARMAGYSLVAYALGLSAFMLIKVLITGYFSRQDTRTPVKIGIIAMVANMVFNLLLVFPFHWWLKAGHVGLALATTVSAFLNAGLLFRGLRASGFFAMDPGWGRYLALLLSATLLMAATLWFAIAQLPPFAEQIWWLRVMHLGWLCVLGLGVYGGVLYAGGWRLQHVRPAFKSSPPRDPSQS